MATKWVNRKGKEQEVEVQAIYPYINDEYRGFIIEWDGTNGWENTRFPSSEIKSLEIVNVWMIMMIKDF